MTQQTINIGSAANDGNGDPLRTAFSKTQSNFEELYNATPVALESFAGADDTAKFAAALASGERVFANADSYDIDPSSLAAITTGVVLQFGRNTVINSLQTSGTKLPILRFEGGGLQGSATNVTAIEGDAGVSTTYLCDTVTVASTSGLAVGDVVLLSENEADQLETRFTGTAINQDFNYREYLTISAIAGNDITFEEFLRFPYDTGNSLTLQKVDFLEGVHIDGGIFAGPNAAGGGVSFEYCRNSSVNNLRCVGTSESNKNGGNPLHVENSWQCSFANISCKHTLFLLQSTRNQSCQYTRIQGKRTGNGGIIIAGDRFCEFSSIVCDSVGDDNGDAFGFNNGARNNLITDVVIHGARCYSIWMHQSCDNNAFDSFHSRSGVTAAFNIYGDDNQFSNCSAKGHDGAGINDGGLRNFYDAMDIDVGGNGAILDRANGLRLRGKVRTRSTSSFDVQVSNATGCDVETFGGGDRGLNESGTNTSNRLVHFGETPFDNRAAKHKRGYQWAKFYASVTSTAQDFKVVDDDNNEITLEGTTQSGSNGDMYHVILKYNTNVASLSDSWSEYLIVVRFNALEITTIYEGSQAFTPKLAESSGKVVISADSTGACSSLVTKF